MNQHLRPPIARQTATDSRPSQHDHHQSPNHQLPQGQPTHQEPPDQHQSQPPTTAPMSQPPTQSPYPQDDSQIGNANNNQTVRNGTGGGSGSSAGPPVPEERQKTMPKVLEDFVITLPPAANQPELIGDPGKRFRQNVGRVDRGTASGRGKVHTPLRPQNVREYRNRCCAHEKRGGGDVVGRNNSKLGKRTGCIGDNSAAGVGGGTRMGSRTEEIDMNGVRKTTSLTFPPTQNHRLNLRPNPQPQRAVPFLPPRLAKSPASRTDCDWKWGQPQDVLEK